MSADEWDVSVVVIRTVCCVDILILWFLTFLFENLLKKFRSNACQFTHNIRDVSATVRKIRISLQSWINILVRYLNNIEINSNEQCRRLWWSYWKWEWLNEEYAFPIWHFQRNRSNIEISLIGFWKLALKKHRQNGWITHFTVDSIFSMAILLTYHISFYQLIQIYGEIFSMILTLEKSK